MSFSTDVKEELSKINNLSNKKCVKLELIGYGKTTNVNMGDKRLRFSTESEYNINRFAKLLHNLTIEDYQICMQGKNYVIITKNKEAIAILQEKIENLETDIEEKAFVRGIFLGSGSLNNPKRTYHLEISLKTSEDALFILKLLEKYDIHFKLLKKTNSTSLYSKDGEEISKFLALIGAGASVLKFEDIRVYRDMRNNVNRLVNCETANLSKTVHASMKQIEAIKKIQEKGKMHLLSDSLKEMAELRINHPEASLIELGKMTTPETGKSGVNYRLRAIMKIAEEI